MFYLRVLARYLFISVCMLGLPLLAQDKYILVTSPTKVQDVCGNHGLTQITQVSSRGVFLVSTFSVDPTIATDSSVQSFEANRALGVPELSGATIASLTNLQLQSLMGCRAAPLSTISVLPLPAIMCSSRQPPSRGSTISRRAAAILPAQVSQSP